MLTAATLLGGTPANAGVTWLQKLLAADRQEDDQFGRSVALEGSILAISAPLDDDGGSQSGSVYLFERTGAAWSPLTKLLPDDPRPHQVLGLAGLDLDNGRLLVGATGDGTLGSQAGAAYLFEGSGGTWSESAKLLPGDGAPYDSFGWAVALDGNTAAVSAYLSDGTATDTGAVYVYEESGGSWTEQAKLVPPDGAASDRFGFRIDLLGDTLVVGAPWDDDLGSLSGSIYVYHRSQGAWSLATKLMPQDGRSGDQFGHDVALTAERLVVGAAYVDGLAQDSGAAYVYQGSGSNWTLEARLDPSETAPFDNFGSRVAIEGGSVIVTSAKSDHALGVDAGSATVFTWANGTWTEQVTLHAPDGQGADLYAADVALAGGLAVLGAYRDDAPIHDEGSAHVYRASSPIGESYCTSTPNSSGNRATICATGSPFAADRSLSLEVDGLPPGVPGILYFGPGQVQAPFGDGTRCVGNGPQYRVYPYLHADAQGFAVLPLSWDAGYGDELAVGASLNFQVWYRDGSAGGAGFNLTDAVNLTLQ